MTHPVSLTLLAQCSSNFLPHTYCNNDISERTIGRNNLASCGHSPCRDNHKHCDTCILLQQQGSKQHAQVKVQLTAPNSHMAMYLLPFHTIPKSLMYRIYISYFPTRLSQMLPMCLQKDPYDSGIWLYTIHPLQMVYCTVHAFTHITKARNGLVV